LDNKVSDKRTTSDTGNWICLELVRTVTRQAMYL